MLAVNKPQPSKPHVSEDYERPYEDVADMPDPVSMPTNKARQGVRVRGMRSVLIGGIVIALIGMAIAYVLLT